MPEYIDKPEPRGQTIAAVLAIGAIYLALPRNVVVGPIWLLPTVIVVLLVPTVVSHRVGKQSINRIRRQWNWGDSHRQWRQLESE